ncbi:MAG: hypothetical protein GC160_06130 [Acidobacteria bacterium]|nr:hypothetical protein [Acidobacteriota bacterium]
MAAATPSSISKHARGLSSADAATVAPDRIGVYRDGLWRLDRNGDGALSPGQDATFGLGFPGAQQFVADFNGDGYDEVAVFARGFWFIDLDGNGVWDGGVADALFPFGWDGATPVVGDWNGDGVTDVGVFALGFWFLDADGNRVWDGGVADQQFPFGWEGVTPIVGDWDGDGRDQVGAFNLGFWLLDYNGNAAWDGAEADRLFAWWWEGAKIVIGDWDGDGRDQAGAYGAGMWILDQNGDMVWDGGVADRVVFLGGDGALPVAGDWNADGSEEVGVFSGGEWRLDANGSGVWEPGEDSLYTFGSVGDAPAVGRWREAPPLGQIKIDPPDGSTEIAVNRHIILTLPAAVDPATVGPETVQVLRNGAPVDVTRSVSLDGRYISIAGALTGTAAGVAVDVKAQGLQTPGGGLIQPLQTRITSSGQIYHGGATGIWRGPGRTPTNAKLFFGFSAPINPVTAQGPWVATSTQSGRTTPLHCALDPSWTRLTCEADSPFDVGSDYGVGGQGIKDLYSRSVSLSSFQTGFGPDTTPPQITGSAPSDGGKLLAGDDLIIYFDEPVALDRTDQVQLTQNGAPVELALSGGNEQGYTLEFRPIEWLPPGLEYDLTVEGVRDLGGNPMQGRLTARFLVVPREGGSQSTWVQPEDDSLDVPLNASVMVYFWTPVIPATVSSQTLRLRGSAGWVSGQVRADLNGQRVVFQPDQALQPNTLYTAELTRSYGDGTRTVTSRKWQFRTGSSADTEPPRVERFWPPHQSINNPQRTRPGILLSKDLAPGSVNRKTVRLTASDGSSPYYSLNASGRLIEIVPSSLPPNVLYTFEATGVTDLAGNTLAPFVSVFQTAAISDNISPAVVSMTPAAGTQGVDPATNVIELLLSEPLNPLTVTSVTTGIEGLPSSASLSQDLQRVRITPLYPLRPNTTYTVFCGAVDPFGNRVAFPVTPSFTTGPGAPETTPPQVTNISIAEGERVQIDDALVFDITFSEPVDPTTVNADSVLMVVNGRRMPRSPSARSIDNRRYTYRITSDGFDYYQPNPDIAFNLTVNDQVRDFAGNGLAPTVSRRFQVDRLRRGLELSVREVLPNGDDADPSAPISILFNAPFVATDTSQTLYVSEDGRLVAGETVALAGNQVLQFRPARAWAPGALVQAFVRPDLMGAVTLEPISYPLLGRIVQVAPDPSTTPLQVVSFAPAPSSCCAPNPVNIRFAARLNKAVDPSTVTEESVQVLDGRSLPIPVTVRLIYGDTIEATPVTTLSVGAYYHLSLTSLIADLAGGPLQPSLGPGIQIGAPADVTGPQILAVSPPDGLANVPLNARIRVRVSKRINEARVRKSSLTVSCGGIVQPMGSIGLDNYESLVIEGRLESILPPSQSCRVDFSGAEDVSGHPTGPTSWTFRTGVRIDADAPNDPVRSPTSEAGTNAIVTFRFDEPIDPTSVSPEKLHFAYGSPPVSIPGNYGFSSDGHTFSFVPDRPLAVGESHSLSHYGSGLKDLAGNEWSFGAYQFRVGFSPDLDPPSVTSTNIEDGEQNASPFVELEANLDEAIDELSVTPQTVQLLDGGSPMELNLQVGNNRNTIFFTPLASLQLDHTYTIRITGLRDQVGNVMATPFQSKFKTRPEFDFSGPTAKHNVSGGSRRMFRDVAVKVRFSEPMDPASIRPDTAYYQIGGTPWPTTPILDPTGSLMRLHPDSPLPAMTSVQIVVTDQATDLSGNGFNQQSFPFGSFYTGTEIDDVTAPTIVWPDLLENSPLPVTFPWGLLTTLVKEPLDPWSYEGDLIQMFDSSGALVRPWTQLAPNATYTLRVQPATDYADNPVEIPAPLTFTTGTFRDTVPPTVVQSAPAANEVDVRVDTLITVDFSEPVWLGNGYFGDGAFVGDALDSFPAKYWLSADRMRLTIDPVDDLSPYSRYSVTIFAYDIGNNVLVDDSTGGYYWFEFTTGGPLRPDSDPPVLLSVNPPDGATDVTDPTATLTFSKPVNRHTVGPGVALFVNGQDRGTATVSADGATVVIRPSGQIPDQAEMTILVTEALTDLSGNSAAAFLSRFSYANQTPQPTPKPHVQSIRPPSGAVDAAPNAPIYAFFSAPIDPASVNSAVLVSEDGVLAAGTLSVLAGDQVIRFTPAQPYAAGSRIRLFLDQSLLLAPDGQPVSNYRYESNFMVAGEAPTDYVQAKVSVGSETPLNAHIVVEFDRPMDPTTFTADRITLGSPARSIHFAFEDGNTRLRIIPDALLPANTYLKLQFSREILALDGTPIARSVPWSYTIRTSGSEIVEPVVLRSISPPDGAVGVGSNGSIDLVFSGRVNPLTLNGQTIHWMDTAGRGVPCMISISTWSQRTTVKVTPHDPFESLGEYTLTVEGVEDLIGRTVPPRTVGFTAGERPDFVRPQRTGYSPLGNSAPLNAVIEVHFDEPLSSGSVFEEGAVQLLQFQDNYDYNGTPTPAVISLSADNRTILVQPATPLEPNRRYAVAVTEYVRDLSGNSVTSIRSEFTTGTANDVTPPSLVNAVPAEGATEVPINHSIVLEFDSAIRPESVTDLVRIEAGGSPIPIDRTVSGSFLELRPKALFDLLTPYVWIVEGVQDLAGNTVATPLTGTFSTGPTADLSPLEATVSPDSEATNVPRDTVIVFHYNRALNPRFLSAQSFGIWSQGELPFDYTVSDDLQTVTIRPLQPLPANASISVTHIGPRDLTGASLQARGVTFTTGN